MRRYLIFAALLAGLGYGCYDVGQRGAQAFERMLDERVSSGLDALGHGWASVEADGLELTIRGHAPAVAARDLALESARAIAPLAHVVSYATAALAPPAHRDPVRVELLRDENGITLTGQTASRALRQGLVAALAEDGPEIAVEDLTGIQAAAPMHGLRRELGVASLAASRLPNAYVVMEPGEVTIDGQAADEAGRKALTQALLDRAGENVRLVLHIRIPPRVIAPFVFSAYKNADAGIRLEQCAARTYEEQAAIREQLASGRILHMPDPCPVGLGGPEGDWSAAVAAAIRALAALPAGSVDLRYRDLHLEAAPPTTPPELSAVLETLRIDLPAGFTGTGRLRVDDADTRAAIARGEFWMDLRRSGDGIVLTGGAPDDIVRTAIETEAKALYGARGVHSMLTVTAAPPPGGWLDAALHFLDDLHELSDGEAKLAGHRAALQGVIHDPSAARRLHDRAITELPDFEITTSFRVDLPAALAAIPLPPPRCAAALNRINRDHAIDFPAGSAEVTDQSARVLDAMAETLSRCAGPPIVIGGHTDSQGSDELNRRLSQARAEAVHDALIERGVAPGRIIARGFGSAMPIASNESAAGRARNRRIEFRPVS